MKELEARERLAKEKAEIAQQQAESEAKAAGKSSDKEKSEKDKKQAKRDEKDAKRAPAKESKDAQRSDFVCAALRCVADAVCVIVQHPLFQPRTTFPRLSMVLIVELS
jgi:hypothetical protein